jgi:SET domain-containing protein
MNISNIGKQKQLTYVAITANQDIKKGDEITINYGKAYFNETEGIELPQSVDISDTIKNILKKYMNKAVFHQVYNNLALANCECIYHYDNESIFIAK